MIQSVSRRRVVAPAEPKNPPPGAKMESMGGRRMVLVLAVLNGEPEKNVEGGSLSRTGASIDPRARRYGRRIHTTWDRLVCRRCINCPCINGFSTYVLTQSKSAVAAFTVHPKASSHWQWSFGGRLVMLSCMLFPAFVILLVGTFASCTLSPFSSSAHNVHVPWKRWTIRNAVSPSFSVLDNFIGLLEPHRFPSRSRGR